MQILLLPLVALLLFYFDTIINYFLPLHVFNVDFYWVSHLVLVYLLILTVYKNANIAMIIGVLFGIISDVYLGTVYGVYTFGYIILIFLMDQLFKVFYKDIKMMIVLFLSFIALFEHFEYIVFHILGFTQMNYFVFIFTYVIPSICVNLLMILLVFPLVLKFLDRYVID